MDGLCPTTTVGEDSIQGHWGSAEPLGEWGCHFLRWGCLRGAEFGKENQGSCGAKLHLKQSFQIVQEAVAGGVQRVVSGGACSLRPG